MNRNDMIKTSQNSWRIVLCLIVMLTGTAAQAVDNNLRIVFTTTDAGGSYGNRHVHAVWLTTPSGQWVCTVGNIEVDKRAIWADRRAYSLSSWWGTNPNRTSDVDARTSATQTAYKTYTINWNWRTLDRELIPDGAYLMHFECTNADSGNPRNYTTVAVTKGNDPWTIGPLNQGGYRDITLVHTIIKLGTQTLPPTDVTERSVVLHGSIVNAEARQKLPAWFYWGDNDGAAEPGDWDYRVALGEQRLGEFTMFLDYLTENTTYYYRTAARDGATMLWAPETIQFQAQATVTVFQAGDFWRYFEGRTYPGDAWTTLDYDDQDWAQGPAGFGFGDDDDWTLVDMQGQYVTLYLRKYFEIEGPSDVSKLTFTVDYDDGFVAYINGTEVARRGVDLGQDNTTTAQTHEASVDGGDVETLELDPTGIPLAAGDNVFAIEVHNQSIDSSDLTMIPMLTVTGGVSSPQPNITIDADLLDFGVVQAGQSKELTFTVINQGQLPLTLEALNVTGLNAGPFTVTSLMSGAVTLASNEALDVTVQFHPTEARSAVYTKLLIASDDWDQPVMSVSLQGQGQ